jgi:Fe-S-cluster containining protein
MQCKQCGSCCRGYPDDHVWLNKRDIKRLAKHFAIDFEAAQGRFSVEGHLAEKTNGDCVYLEGNLCFLYEARPEHCRHFAPGGVYCKEARSQR